MRPRRWLRPKLMPNNNEDTVAPRAMRVEPPLRAAVGSSIPLGRVRRPTTSVGQRRRAGRGNGMALLARTDAATCASRIPIPCAVMGTKRRARRRNEQRSLLISSPALGGAFFGAPFLRLRRKRHRLEWCQSKSCLGGNDGQPTGGSKLPPARRARAKFIPNQTADLVLLHRLDRRL